MTYVWIGFFVLVAALLALDLGVLNREHHVIGFKEASRWTAFWITLGVSFGGLVYLIYENHWFGVSLAHQSPLVSDGVEALTLYITGYLLEKSLSIDNIFVIAIVFERFGIARQYRHRVLFWGILGVIVLRALMIGLGAALVSEFSWVLYLFGAFLIATGIKMLIVADNMPDIENNPILKFLRRRLRVTEQLHGQDFVVHKPDPVTGAPVRYATPLLLALMLIELADLVFAVDSIPAIFAITQDPFIVYTSNIFAILGLRALYFALAAMIHRFHYLKYALALVLVFIGSKIFLVNIIGKTPAWISLSVTIGLLAAGVGYSLYRTRGQNTPAAAH